MDAMADRHTFAVTHYYINNNNNNNNNKFAWGILKRNSIIDLHYWPVYNFVHYVSYVYMQVNVFN